MADEKYLGKTAICRKFAWIMFEAIKDQLTGLNEKLVHLWRFL